MYAKCINQRVIFKLIFLQKQASKESPAVSHPSKISTGRRSSVGSALDLNKRNKKGETLLHVACNKVSDLTFVCLKDVLQHVSNKDFVCWKMITDRVKTVKKLKSGWHYYYVHQSVSKMQHFQCYFYDIYMIDIHCTVVNMTAFSIKIFTGT